MVFRADEIPGPYGSYPLVEGISGFIDREDRVSYATDPDAERQALEEAGFVKGYTEHYANDVALLGGGVYEIGTGVNVYSSAEGATRDLQYTARKTEEATTSSVEGFTIESVEPFEVGDIGQEAGGYVVVASLKIDELPSEVELYITTIAFRRGRLGGGVFIERANREDSRAQARELAHLLDARILAVLGGKMANRSTATPKPKEVEADLLSVDVLRTGFQGQPHVDSTLRSRQGSSRPGKGSLSKPR